MLTLALGLLLLRHALALLPLDGQEPSPGPTYDLLVRQARLVDGTGAPWFLADLAVSGDTIAAIGRLGAVRAERTIDARGQVLAPGFIDIHTHARRGIFALPTADNYVRQGVTTLVEGPDGGSPVPLAAFLERVAATGTAPNFATFIGQGSVREAVMGNVDRPAGAGEIAAMQDLVRQGMRDGAFGLSTGLFYTPGSFTPTEEVIALARVAGELGGLHISHMRDEAAEVLASVAETIRIGEEGGLPTQITHHKIVGAPNRGRSQESLRLVAAARARGVDATIDQYPYTASSTTISSALLPAWALAGERAELLARLSDTATRERIREVVIARLRDERGGGDAANVTLSSCEWDRSLEGRNLAELTRARQLEPTLENAADTVLAIAAAGDARGVFHAIAEEDLERILRSPYTMIASDGEIPAFGKGAPHPRSYGTFARVLAVYVRERGVLTLEEAVRKMTSLPAQRLGLADRGLLRPGMKADLVLFDPDAVRDVASFAAPHAYAEGFAAVVVNGMIVFDGQAMTGARPGRVLYGPAHRRRP